MPYSTPYIPFVNIFLVELAYTPEVNEKCGVYSFGMVHSIGSDNGKASGQLHLLRIIFVIRDGGRGYGGRPWSPQNKEKKFLSKKIK